MLRPSISEILQNDESVFSLVIGVAKRAREITDGVEEKKRLLIDQGGGKLPNDLGPFEHYLETKPVRLAVEEFANHKICLEYTQEKS